MRKDTAGARKAGSSGASKGPSVAEVRERYKMVKEVYDLHHWLTYVRPAEERTVAKTSLV